VSPVKATLPTRTTSAAERAIRMGVSVTTTCPDAAPHCGPERTDHWSSSRALNGEAIDQS
jgi:hypothetical protein